MLDKDWPSKTKLLAWADRIDDPEGTCADIAEFLRRCANRFAGKEGIARDDRFNSIVAWIDDPAYCAAIFSGAWQHILRDGFRAECLLTKAGFLKFRSGARILIAPFPESEDLLKLRQSGQTFQRIWVDSPLPVPDLLVAEFRSLIKSLPDSIIPVSLMVNSRELLNQDGVVSLDQEFRRLEQSHD